ncbi:MAG: 4-hydroxythreonine-4-phosphate dehydrogenase PdxA [Proteobacteria bacterium]|nr:4-hydroxythreonine-4-phosphate dehydrogenase PdxA [Pseudomonadota bacterium]
MTLPLVAITMGDPAGIGPEIVAKVAAQPQFHRDHRAFAVGDPERLAAAARMNNLPLRIEPLVELGDFWPQPGVLHVLSGPKLPPGLPYGRVDPRAGRAAFAYVQSAIALANSGQIHAICTAPINKEALASAGVAYPGHTEMLAELSGSSEVAMMLVSSELRVVLVTIHCSLREAIEQLSIDAELRVIRLAHKALRTMGFPNPRMAIAGLNPHASEGGLFGREDIDIVAPAVRTARAEGIDITGPHPADTIFMLARRGAYDIVVAQYHDQGLIPIKFMGVEHGVNVTIGLPFIRTSPDHGTAFDIAGSGVADASSLQLALDTARDLSRVAAKGYE